MAKTTKTHFPTNMILFLNNLSGSFKTFGMTILFLIVVFIDTKLLPKYNSLTEKQKSGIHKSGQTDGLEIQKKHIFELSLFNF